MSVPQFRGFVSETGLYYNRFRYYDPNLGQYISQDPIGLAGGNPTLYGYVGDTNTWIDPLGLSRQKPYSSSLTDEQFLRRIANAAERWGVRNGFGPAGSGPLQGTQKHDYARRLLQRYQRAPGQRQHLQTEQSFFRGQSTRYGFPGSSRPDVFNPTTGQVFDYKFTRNPNSPISLAQQARNLANIPGVTSQTAIHP